MLVSVCDAGGLSLSVLWNCSLPGVASVHSGLGSESELSGALKLQRLDSP